MSRELNDGQKNELKSAIKAIVQGADQLKKAPRFSTRADNFAGQIAIAAEVGKKLLTELGDSITPDTPPNLPDSGRGDWDTKGERSSVPKGLTSTASMSGGTGSNQGSGSKSNASKEDKSLGYDKGLNEDGTQTFGHSHTDPHRDNLVPGLSGHPVKRDDRERAGNEYTVDSSTHRAAAAGEHTNADTLEGGRKAMEQGGENWQRDMAPGTAGNPANVSEPFKQGQDTTNTSSEGSGKPDNFFAQHAPKAQTDKSGPNDEDGKTPLKREADTPRKYDSENRVATETLGHLAEKERMAREGGGDGGTSSTSTKDKPDPFNSENPSAVEKSEDDKKQETLQGDATAKANTNKPQTPAIGKESDAPTKGKDDARR